MEGRNRGSLACLPACEDAHGPFRVVGYSEAGGCNQSQFFVTSEPSKKHIF